MNIKEKFGLLDRARNTATSAGNATGNFATNAGNDTSKFATNAGNATSKFATNSGNATANLATDFGNTVSQGTTGFFGQIGDFFGEFSQTLLFGICVVLLLCCLSYTLPTILKIMFI